MSNKRYPEEFKIEAVKQVTVAGHSVADVAERLGMTTHSLYAWIRRYGPDSEQHNQAVAEAAVMDLFSRRIIGWAMGARMTKELVLDALMMAVWRRNPKHEVLIHSDQGSQFTSHDWNDFLKAHNLKGSMSRRGNCHDNASFFQLLMSHHNKVGNYTKKVGN